MAYYGDDDYDYERRYRGRRPSPRRNISDVRRSTHFLDPNVDGGGGGLYRTRSQGHGPVPIVNTYVDVVQDNNQRASSPYPPYPPDPGYDRRDRSRDRSRDRRDRLGDDLLDAMDELNLERRRSRSRGRSDFGAVNREDYYDWERRRKSEEERFKKDMELERIRTEEREQQVIDEYERKKRKQEDDRKAEEQRIKDKIKQDEKDEEEKKDREWKEFLRKQKEKDDEKKQKDKEEEEKIEAAMRERFLNMGYSKATADTMIQREKYKRTEHTTITSSALTRLEAPTYAKVKREHIAVETLKYFGIPWEYDRKDKRYIIILREMTEQETDMLFEHTKQLNEKKLPLLLEPPKDRPAQYAFYRKRDRSGSRVRKSGILKYED